MESAARRGAAPCAARMKRVVVSLDDVSDAWRAPAVRGVVPGTVVDVRRAPCYRQGRPALHPLC